MKVLLYEYMYVCVSHCRSNINLKIMSVFCNIFNQNSSFLCSFKRKSMQVNCWLYFCVLYIHIYIPLPIYLTFFEKDWAHITKTMHESYLSIISDPTPATILVPTPVTIPDLTPTTIVVPTPTTIQYPQLPPSCHNPRSHPLEFSVLGLVARCQKEVENSTW